MTMPKCHVLRSAVLTWTILSTLLCSTGCVRETGRPEDRPPESGRPTEPLDGGALVPSVPESARLFTEVRGRDGSGEAVWAPGYEGELIAGLDGTEYLPYAGSAIERIQELLRTRGLYTGPINGILDLPTMESIAVFQEATQTLQVSGIPTPRTRQMLRQGSHTI